MVSTDEILKKYGNKLDSQINSFSQAQNYSQDYIKFKQETIPEISKYKNWADSLGNFIKLKISQKERAKIQRSLNIAHLNIDASQSMSLAVTLVLIVFILTVFITAAVIIFTGKFPLLFVFLSLITAVFVYYYVYTMPKRLANIWRLKASSQMVPAILYVVVYMKHTSNLERAIEFASEHLEPPLALDFKKIFYDVEIGKYSTIKHSLDSYLESWRDYSPEFIESFHLIESSLFEPSEARRIQILEKSLQVILDGIYEKMLVYSRSIRSPLTNVYMLGIILPTLALALLPLASTLLGDLIKWYHILILFNIIIPFFVFYMVSEILLRRPGGYGESSILELNPNYAKYKSKAPWVISFILVLPLLIIGLLPFIMQIPSLASSLGIPSDPTLKDLGIPFMEKMKVFDFKILNGVTNGPCSPIAVLLSLLFILGIALFFSLAYKIKTKELIKSREKTKFLEQEFTNSLFQLGNRLGDGVPAEIAFSKVAESTQGQQTQKFFSLVNQNIQQLGMSLSSALFDKKRGAIIYFPSALISTSMKILVESSKKGLEVAARSLMSISEYVKNIQKINQRVKDLLAEIVSDMKSNITFLAPLLAGIIVGLSTMITVILGKLKEIQLLTSQNSAAGLGSLANVANIFDINQMIPPYHLQIIIGIYLIEITFILTSALVTVNSGRDKLKEKYDLSRYLKTGIILYAITAIVSIVALTLLSSVALSGLAG